MTFCLHANQKTVSCGTWENSSSWRPCIPQRFPKICCTHGPHIGSESFLPKLSGLLGFCKVPQLANLLIKYVHVQRRKHAYICIYIYIYIYICIDTLTRYTDKDTSCYKHNSHQCTTHGKASLAKFKFTPQLMALPEGGVLCQNSQEMKKESTKSANNAESNEGIAFQKHYYTWPKSLPLSRNSLIVKKP